MKYYTVEETVLTHVTWLYDIEASSEEEAIEKVKSGEYMSYDMLVSDDVNQTQGIMYEAFED